MKPASAWICRKRLWPWPLQPREMELWSASPRRRTEGPKEEGVFGDITSVQRATTNSVSLVAMHRAATSGCQPEVCGFQSHRSMGTVPAVPAACTTDVRADAVPEGSAFH